MQSQEKIINCYNEVADDYAAKRSDELSKKHAGTTFKSKVTRIDTMTQTFRTTPTQGHHFGYHSLLAFLSILFLDVQNYICNSD